MIRKQTDRHRNRSYVIRGIFIVVVLIFLLRLFYLQIFTDEYKELASKNVLRKLTIYPSRGLIYDRNGKLVVYNEAMYDLMVTPSHVKNIDTATFCRLLGVEEGFFRKQLKEASDYSRYKPSVFMKQIASEEYANFQEHLYRFPGFYAQIRTVRKYPHKSAAHILGYVSEVDQSEIDGDKGNYYRMGDYVGKSGIEKEYEKQLRGTKGTKYVLVDVHNREQGDFEKGKFDTAAVAGKDLVVSLDIILQNYGEKLMQNKKGSIVAIEPETGEILAMISSPSYDPNLLTGRQRGDNFNLLLKDTLKPLYNRPIMAQYPPGSTFKPVMALIGLEENTITANTYIGCSMGGYFGVWVGCHEHPPATNLKRAIQYSCNAYFCNTFKRVIDDSNEKNVEDNYKRWYDHVTSFGLGDKLNIDLPNEKSGHIPTAGFYNELYKGWRWKASTIISLGIGQGEITSTPLQIANMFASIANNGYYYTPHVIRYFKNDGDSVRRFDEKFKNNIDPEYYEVVNQGMVDVINAGTGRIAKLDSFQLAGKTGTAENPHGKDHSIFAAYAPVGDPQIVVAAVVENAGFGSTWAAPIVSLMIEKYMNRKIAEKRKWLEKRILDANLLDPENKERIR